MSLSWVWWISMSRGWVRWRQGEGQEESEPCPQVTGCSMQYSRTTGTSVAAELSAEGRAGVKHCKLSLWEPCGERGYGVEQGAWRHPVQTAQVRCLQFSIAGCGAGLQG